LSPLIILVLILAVAFVIFTKLQGAGIAKDLYKSKPLMTENEKEFFNRLVEALPNHYVFSQVALGALLQPNVKGNNKKYYSVRGTFAQKIADYVVCDQSMSIIAIVELDDKTHSNDKDGKRDLMLEQAGYKVIRWNSKKKPSAVEIRDKIKSFDITERIEPT
jgi:hypothetical protein